MREYKFRGFATAPEKWVYGNLMEKYDPTKKENVIWCRFIQDKALSMEQVAIDSVGQFTGLKDKNGKEIYEGDILSHTDDGVFHVVYVEELAMFKRLFGDGQRLEFMRLTAPRFCEVIGNIFENPDLINPT